MKGIGYYYGKIAYEALGAPTKVENLKPENVGNAFSGLSLLAGYSLLALTLYIRYFTGFNVFLLKKADKGGHALLILLFTFIPALLINYLFLIKRKRYKAIIQTHAKEYQHRRGKYMHFYWLTMYFFATAAFLIGALLLTIK